MALIQIRQIDNIIQQPYGIMLIVAASQSRVMQKVIITHQDMKQY